MSLPWHQRKARLASLLKSHGDEEADGIALDRLMHGQSVIGKTSTRFIQHNTHLFKIPLNLSLFLFDPAKTTELDALRFQDKDLNVIGPLEYGQFGVVCLLLSRSFVAFSSYLD